MRWENGAFFKFSPYIYICRISNSTYMSIRLVLMYIFWRPTPSNSIWSLKILNSPAHQCKNRLYKSIAQFITLKMESQKHLQGSYWLVRILFNRFHAFIYIMAFVIALCQNEHLIGEKGLTPAKNYLRRIHTDYDLASLHARFDLFLRLPTLFWFLTPTTRNLYATAMVGLTLSSLVFAWGQSNILISIVLWLTYMSIVNVGQTWYSFGWVRQRNLASFSLQLNFICFHFPIGKSAVGD